MPTELFYPTRDGRPIGETPVHRVNLTDAIAMLEDWFKGRSDVYVSGNMMMYYIEGDRRTYVSPDVFVVFDVPPVYRDCYKTWMEPNPTLDFVIELTSESTREEDLETKFELYRTVLGVREYCLFDPFEEYLCPSTQLFRLVDGEFTPVARVNRRLPSEVLGLHIERSGNFLRFWNPVEQARLPTRVELAESQRARADRFSAEAAQAIAAQERARADAAEAQVARLQAELDALRNGHQS